TGRWRLVRTSTSSAASRRTGASARDSPASASSGSTARPEPGMTSDTIPGQRPETGRHLAAAVFLPFAAPNTFLHDLLSEDSLSLRHCMIRPSPRSTEAQSLSTSGLQAL